MIPVNQILEKKISQAIEAQTGKKDLAAMVKPAADPKFGHYQANGIMAAAKKTKQNPRQLAEKVVENLNLHDISQTPQIAGPGFINITLKPEYIKASLIRILQDSRRLAVDKTPNPQKTVVDFSGPNIAKQMHVGHLRSTIIGDCICRIYEFLGHQVIRQNHIGDWGTQFGMLIALLRRKYPKIIQNPQAAQIADLEQFYKDAKQLCDSNPDFEKHARMEVVKLHEHDPDTIKIWQHIVDQSRKHYQPIYDKLNVKLDRSSERGESFYAEKLGDTVNDLKEKGIAQISDQAVCVFPPGFKNKDDKPLPFIIQKSDGAFLYATTDLAALHYRIKELNAKHIIYVTDARQQLHFNMLFAVAQMAEWTKNVKLEHITFGTMLGEDGKPFKTRSGQNVKLNDLLSQAVNLARNIVEQKNPSLSNDEKEKIADAVGIGAVKYADYSNNRNSDYVFSFEKMLAMDGNTAPYMQYAHARVRSIERKAAHKGIDVDSVLKNLTEQNLNIQETPEMDLAVHLLRYSEAISAAAADCRPNYLTQYLYDLAQKFSTFYNNCPVINADQQKLPARMLLCRLTANTIAHGMKELLAIEVPQRM
jgi:arginyl-tRNA synthetase